MSNEPIETEVIPEKALVVRQTTEIGLFGTQEPSQVIGKAQIVAQALKDVIVKQGLVSRIQGKEYPRCEAWTLLGTMLGVFPVLCWSRQVDGGWEARVEARTKDGAIVGAAEAECLRSERNWKDRDDFALRSMAQTRATAKCLRMPLGFVMSLSGFEPTPAEEMVADHPHQSPLVPVHPKPEPAKPSPFPTESSRKKMLDELKANPAQPNRDIVTEFFRKVPGHGPDSAQLAPFEELEELKLIWVPATKGQMKDLAEKITEFGNGGQVVRPFPPHDEPTKSKKAGEEDELPGLPSKSVVSDAWRNVIIPIPPKGMKRDAYLKNPQTIGQLFDMRHGQDEESQGGRQRLWGFVNHFQAKPWVGKDGQERPPSKTDVQFREALDLFQLWLAANHPGEKL